MGHSICSLQDYRMKSLLFAALATTLAIYAFAAPEPKNVITCTICTDLVGILDETITDNTTISEVVDIMHGFCDILIGLEAECYDFVDTNVQIIVDLLVNQYLSPEAICGKNSLVFVL